MFSWQQAPRPIPPNALLPQGAVHFWLSRFPQSLTIAGERSKQSTVMLFLMLPLYCDGCFERMDVDLDFVNTNKSPGEASWLWALIADDWGYPQHHFLTAEMSRSRWKGLNLLYILSFLRMVDELSKQKDIKPILCAPCVCWTRLVGPCLSAEDGPRCRASCSQRVN